MLRRNVSITKHHGMARGTLAHSATEMKYAPQDSCREVRCVSDIENGLSTRRIGNVLTHSGAPGALPYFRDTRPMPAVASFTLDCNSASPPRHTVATRR